MVRKNAVFLSLVSLPWLCFKKITSWLSLSGPQEKKRNSKGKEGLGGGGGSFLPHLKDFRCAFFSFGKKKKHFERRPDLLGLDVSRLIIVCLGMSWYDLLTLARLTISASDKFCFML